MSTMEIDFYSIHDPDGHKSALRLKGDWLVVAITDGQFTGFGEASHSGDNSLCCDIMRCLFQLNIHGMVLSLERIHQLETSVFSSVDDFITATAISAINQAMYDLLAKKMGIPVWQLFTQDPMQKQVSYYTTINRALRDRTVKNYLEIVERATDISIKRIKCAPFESVNQQMTTKEQSAAATQGLAVLDAIRSANPELGIRVDFHNRFHLDAFLWILPQLETLQLEWIEEPCLHASDFYQIRQLTEIPLAAGELFFGTHAFMQLIEGNLVDVIMPDVKHVGGFGPLVAVCHEAGKKGVRVSPHNPSGPVACAATIHAAAVSKTVTSVETVFLSSGNLPLNPEGIENGFFEIPANPGWGFDFSF